MIRLHLLARIKLLKQRISRDPIAQRCAAIVLSNYIRLVYLTSRKKLDYHADSLPYMKGEKNVIFAFWHGRLMMIAPTRPRNREMKVLVSHHNDGELIAMTVDALGVDSIRGSSSSGGSKAARDILKTYRQGLNISITPDGPRGPALKAKEGIIHLARLCDTPIIPVAIASSHHHRLDSWDEMEIAYPFSRLAIVTGEPFIVDKDTARDNTDALLLRLEDALNSVTTRADVLAAGRK